MVLRLKTWESRSLPGLPSQQTIDNHRHQRRRHKRRLCCLRNKYAGQARSPQTRCSSPPQRRAQARSANKQRYRAQTQAIQNNAGWSSPVARQAHNLKVVSSNLAPATTDSDRPRSKERGRNALGPADSATRAPNHSFLRADQLPLRMAAL